MTAFINSDFAAAYDALLITMDNWFRDNESKVDPDDWSNIMNYMANCYEYALKGQPSFACIYLTLSYSKFRNFAPFTKSASLRYKEARKEAKRL